MLTPPGVTTLAQIHHLTLGLDLPYTQCEDEPHSIPCTDDDNTTSWCIEELELWVGSKKLFGRDDGDECSLTVSGGKTGMRTIDSFDLRNDPNWGFTVSELLELLEYRKGGGSLDLEPPAVRFDSDYLSLVLEGVVGDFMARGNKGCSDEEYCGSRRGWFGTDEDRPALSRFMASDDVGCDLGGCTAKSERKSSPWVELRGQGDRLQVDVDIEMFNSRRDTADCLEPFNCGTVEETMARGSVEMELAFPCHEKARIDVGGAVKTLPYCPDGEPTVTCFRKGGQQLGSNEGMVDCPEDGTSELCGLCATLVQSVFDQKVTLADELTFDAEGGFLVGLLDALCSIVGPLAVAAGCNSDDIATNAIAKEIDRSLFNETLFADLDGCPYVGINPEGDVQFDFRAPEACPPDASNPMCDVAFTFEGQGAAPWQPSSPAAVACIDPDPPGGGVDPVAGGGVTTTPRPGGAPVAPGPTGATTFGASRVDPSDAAGVTTFGVASADPLASRAPAPLSVEIQVAPAAEPLVATFVTLAAPPPGALLLDVPTETHQALAGGGFVQGGGGSAAASETKLKPYQVDDLLALFCAAEAACAEPDFDLATTLTALTPAQLEALATSGLAGIDPAVGATLADDAAFMQQCVGSNAAGELAKLAALDAWLDVVASHQPACEASTPGIESLYPVPGLTLVIKTNDHNVTEQYAFANVRKDDHPDDIPTGTRNKYACHHIRDSYLPPANIPTCHDGVDENGQPCGEEARGPCMDIRQYQPQPEIYAPEAHPNGDFSPFHRCGDDDETNRQMVCNTELFNGAGGGSGGVCKICGLPQDGASDLYTMQGCEPEWGSSPNECPAGYVLGSDGKCWDAQDGQPSWECQADCSGVYGDGYGYCFHAGAWRSWWEDHDPYVAEAIDEARTDVHSYYDASICADWVGCELDGASCAARGLACSNDACVTECTSTADCDPYDGYPLRYPEGFICGGADTCVLP